MISIKHTGDNGGTLTMTDTKSGDVATLVGDGTKEVVVAWIEANTNLVLQARDIDAD